jgi:hypothetical protein
VPSSDAPLEFYVDRSLGLVIVPQSLRAAGLVVHTERDVFGDVPEGVPDEEWLRRAGEAGWVVLTKDDRIRYRRAELAILEDYSVKSFIVSGGNISGPDQAQRLVRNINRIRQACRREGPFVYAVRARGIERVWSRSER